MGREIGERMEGLHPVCETVLVKTACAMCNVCFLVAGVKERKDSLY